MTILGVNFTKINVEKKGFSQGKINISNNVTITNVEKADLSLGDTKKDGLNFTFQFTSKYEPNIAEMLIEGTLVYMEDEKRVKEVLKEWKKNKKVPKELMTNIINNVLVRCNIEALLLSREMNLPPPIPLPKVQQKQQ